MTTSPVEDGPLEGHAVVTGAASGLGAATVRRLAAAGLKVAATDLEGSALSSALGTVPGVTIDEVDVRDRPGLDRVLAEVAASGPIRAVVHCAGIAAPVGRLVGRTGRRYDPTAWDDVIAVNLTGTFNVLWAAANVMRGNEPDRRGERGVLITTASAAGHDGGTGISPYAASKAGVITLSTSAARDLAPLAIRVVAISPGSFGTPLFHRGSEEGRRLLTSYNVGPRREGDPDEFAALAEHVIRNPFLNAVALRIDAGFQTTWDRPGD